MCYEASLPVQERGNFGTYELPEICLLRLNTPAIFDKYKKTFEGTIDKFDEGLL